MHTPWNGYTLSLRRISILPCLINGRSGERLVYQVTTRLVFGTQGAHARAIGRRTSPSDPWVHHP